MNSEKTAMTEEDRSQYSMMECLGRAITAGDEMPLAPYLGEKCALVFDHSRCAASGAEETLFYLRGVLFDICSCLGPSYAVVPLEETRRKEVSDGNLIQGEGPINRYALLIQRGKFPEPVAVIVSRLDRDGRFRDLRCSRNPELFCLRFFGQNDAEDSPLDLPNSVAPLCDTPEEKKVTPIEDDRCYIWREAASFVQDWIWYELDGTILNIRRYEDCIAFRYSVSEETYTLFLYAFGKGDPVVCDGKLAEKCLSDAFAADSTVQLLCVHVVKYTHGNGVWFQVQNEKKNELEGIPLRILRRNGSGVEIIKKRLLDPDLFPGETPLDVGGLSFLNRKFTATAWNAVKVLDRPPVPADALQVKRLDCTEYDFSEADLKLLCAFHCLESLSISLGSCDLSFLSTFPHLKWLYLECWNRENRVDFRSFTVLSDLEYLCVSGGDLSDMDYLNLSALTGLRGLRSLHLHEFGETDLAPLAEMPWLEEFSCGYANHISHIEAVGSLQNLKTLTLQGLETDNLDFLALLPADMELVLCGLNVKDICRPALWQRFRKADVCEITFTDGYFGDADYWRPAGDRQRTEGE